MTQEEKNILEDVKKSIGDPVYGVSLNYNLDTCEEFYNKRVKQWNNGDTKPSSNPWVTREEERIPYSDLLDLPDAVKQAKTLIENLKEKDWIKNIEYEVLPKAIVVHWNRLKTFDEWLEEGLGDALRKAYTNVFNDARLYLHNKCWVDGYIWDEEIAALNSWLINLDTFKFLHSRHPSKSFEWRNTEEDIKALKKLLYEKFNKGEVKWEKTIVLTLKI